MRASVLGAMVVLNAQAALAQQVDPSAPVAVAAPNYTLAIRRAVPANTVVADPGALLHGAVLVQYERAVTPSLSVFVGPRVQYGPWVFASSAERDRVGSAFGIGVELGGRVYMHGFAPAGMFIGLVASGLVHSWTEALPGTLTAGPTQQAVTGALIHTGVQLGYQVIVRRAFVVSIGVGVSLVLHNAEVVDWVTPVRLAFGWAF